MRLHSYSSFLSITASPGQHLFIMSGHMHMTMYFRRPIIFPTFNSMPNSSFWLYCNIKTYSPFLFLLTTFIYHTWTAQTYAHSFAVHILIDLTLSIVCPCPTPLISDLLIQTKYRTSASGRRRLIHENSKNLRRRPTSAAHDCIKSLNVGPAMTYVSHGWSLCAPFKSWWEKGWKVLRIDIIHAWTITSFGGGLLCSVTCSKLGLMLIL